MARTAKSAKPASSPSDRAALGSGDTATERQVIDAAVACILECGFYRASTNEIARRAGVTWGVIQYYFGTREGLMLAVLNDGARQFVELVQGVHIEGDTVVVRISHLTDLLLEHYGSPKYMAYLQILLNMDHDPRTSADVRRTMEAVAERSHESIRRLLREALGPAASTPDLATTVFLILRGFGISQQLLDTMAYDTLSPKGDRLTRQRRLLADLLAPHLHAAEGS
jgi:AcrR family transcriptional regulator